MRARVLLTRFKCLTDEHSSLAGIKFVSVALLFSCLISSTKLYKITRQLQYRCQAQYILQLVNTCYIYQGTETVVNNNDLPVLNKLKFIKPHVSAGLQHNLHQAVRYKEKNTHVLHLIWLFYYLRRDIILYNINKIYNFSCGDAALRGPRSHS